MQNRMQLHQLTDEEITKLLREAQVGRIAMHGPDGYPYVLPMHFVWYDGKIYLHGLPRGQKIECIMENSKIGFEVDEMIGLMKKGAEAACDINTEYKSVVISGRAEILSDPAKKEEILQQITLKYAPDFAGKELPPKMIRATAVIEITIEHCTGKFYK